MRWTFDVNADALYVYLTEGRPARQIEIGPGVVVDLSAEGTPVGVELLSPHAAPFLANLVQMGVALADVESIMFLAAAPFSRNLPIPMEDGTIVGPEREGAEDEPFTGVLELIPS